MTDAAATDRWGIVPAAGCGERFSGNTPKQYLHVAGGFIIDHALDALLSCGGFRAVAVSLAGDDNLWAKTRYSSDPCVLTCEGGASRAASVARALDLLQGRVKEDDWVMVHDAARPCLGKRELVSLIREVGDDEVGGLLVAPVPDTVKQIRHDGNVARVECTLARAWIARALTPQMFRYSLLVSALDEARRKGIEVNDEAQAMELAGYSVRAVEGSVSNIKLTYPHELPLVEDWLAHKTR